MRELGRGAAYPQRLLYLQVCATLLGADEARAVSRAYFKASGMLGCTLGLFSDRVANARTIYAPPCYGPPCHALHPRCLHLPPPPPPWQVRLRLCALQPEIKRTLRLPADAQACTCVQRRLPSMPRAPSA